jgi:type IV pilus assembly protein PilV
LKTKSTGLGLVEVLVAVLLLSLGLLGLAQLQATGLRSAHDATLRFTAGALAQDLLERLRARREDALAGNFQGTADWQGAVASALPNGAGSVEFAGRVVTVTVTWDEDVAPPPSLRLRTEL